MSEMAIKVEHLYKEYKLGVISHGTLYRDIQSWWAKIRGKEDPNSLISLHHGQETEKDSFLALNDVSFEIKEGDRVGIIGKNGAGKSTLLKILSRITSPSKGNITIRGKVGSLLEIGTGFHPELTGRENIFLNGSILGMNRHEISRKLDEIVDFAGIEKHLDTPVKRYSSGMMVRLGFAVAAHLDTDILIADEVLAVGDAEFQKKALGKMQDLSTTEGRTVIFVSHNMVAAKSLCNCGILLEKGRIAFNGTISDAIEKYIKPNMHKEIPDSITSFIPELNVNLEARITAESGIGSFKPFAVEVTLSSDARKENIGIHVILSNGEIENICWFASAEGDNKKYNIDIGINKYICYLPALLLASGLYKIRIAVSDPFFSIYYSENDLFFSVPEENIKNSQLINLPVLGITYIPHEWIH